MEIIQKGAEAILIRDKNKLIKDRVKKNYRLNEIDEKIRRFRTRSESKILSKLDFAPKLFSMDDRAMKIEMEFIDGDLLRNILDDLSDKDRKVIARKIGKQIFEMHNKNIIHGDLTTSNMIIKNNKLYFIDFGLGFFSDRLEDKATDLRLLRQALESKHYKCSEKFYREILNAYKNNDVLKWLMEKVERRGRYKRKHEI